MTQTKSINIYLGPAEHAEQRLSNLREISEFLGLRPYGGVPSVGSLICAIADKHPRKVANALEKLVATKEK